VLLLPPEDPAVGEGMEVGKKEVVVAGVARSLR
jgi:hypothetical protein